MNPSPVEIFNAACLLCFLLGIAATVLVLGAAGWLLERVLTGTREDQS